MNPELTVFTENKICDIIDNIQTMDECGSASTVIDSFEDMSDNRETVKGFREYLCGKTFETYGKVYSNTTIELV